MVLIYSAHKTNRLNYVLDLIFRDILGVEWTFAENAVGFNEFKGPKINYSDSELTGGYQLFPHSLLFESGIWPQEINISKWNDLPVFFGNDSAKALPFDLFAMIFFLVSRYEEYLPFDGDEYGRFSYNESIAFKNNFLELPIVNLLALKFREEFQKLYPDTHFKIAEFSFIPTVDIDIAYAHLGKGPVRSALALTKLILGGKFGEIKNRFRTIIGKADDPFDNFDFQLDVMD